MICRTVNAQGDPRAASRGAIIQSGSSLIDNGAFTVEQKYNIEGSLYYIDEWLPGEAVLLENIRSNNIDIKIDTYNDEVHFLSGQDILALDSKYIKSVILNKDGEKIIFKTGFNYPSKNIHQNSFLRVIYDGKIKFLARHTSQVRKSHTSVIASGKVSHEFKHNTDYYLLTANNKYHDLRRLRKKYVINALNEHKRKLQAYADKNNLSWKEEKDIVKILDYYSQL